MRIGRTAIASILASLLAATSCMREDTEAPAPGPPRTGAPAAQGEAPEEPVPPPPAPAEPPAPAPAPAPAPEPAPAGEPAPAPAPAPAAASGDGDPAQGAQLYATYCASCHGPRGDADGPLAATLDPKPAKHADGAYMNALTNDHLFKVIKEGGPAVGKSALMAPWGGTLNDEQIWHLVAFVRSLAQPPYTGPKP